MAIVCGMMTAPQKGVLPALLRPTSHGCGGNVEGAYVGCWQKWKTVVIAAGLKCPDTYRAHNAMRDIFACCQCIELRPSHQCNPHLSIPTWVRLHDHDCGRPLPTCREKLFACFLTKVALSMQIFVISWTALVLSAGISNCSGRVFMMNINTGTLGLNISSTS